MRRNALYFVSVTLAASTWIAGCGGSGSTTSSAGSTTAGASSSAGSAAGTSGGTTQGAGASSSGSATGGNSGTGTGAATSGSTTGAPYVPPIDGGYVRCSLASAADAGGNDDAGFVAGPANWDCTPGTYFCDESGNLGNCFQCLSDTDCLNPALPTYDPLKPRCDLISGVPGYQNHCVVCIGDSDCVGNSSGSLCDVSPSYPLTTTVPSIITLGFETCSDVVTDCRVDGGPTCRGLNVYCDQTNGRCTTRSGACTSDDDCIGLLTPYSINVPQPYCVQGFCNSCPDGICPNGFCSDTSQCIAGAICDLTTYTCSCTDSSQCGGLSPECLGLDGTRVSDAGEILGYCGCSGNIECGDAGMVCLPKNPLTALPPSCGITCSSPDFPDCSTATNGFYPICNPTTGACGICTNDNQCRDGINTGGPNCDYNGGGSGNCGCFNDQDCTGGETCQTGPFLGKCAPILASGLPRCYPGSCATGSFCDWDAGHCVAGPGGALTGCITDYDCAIQGYNTSLCDNGKCIQCRSSDDCINTGATSYGGSLCCLPGTAACQGTAFQSNSCVDACASDNDCKGNYFGPTCELTDGGTARCGCGTDQDCSGSLFGHHCDRDPSDFTFGFCNCVGDSDCAAGQGCSIFSGSTTGYCTYFCYGPDGGGCDDGYSCDPSGACRPRCDNGSQCQGTATICDTDNAVGQNGQLSADADAGGVTWCYPCLQPSDCAAGQGCDPKLGCGHCASTAECPSGTTCLDGGVCQPNCVGGSCASGQVCDTYGLAGYGPGVCFGCITAADCPNGDGCNDLTHTCGTCYGPNATGGPGDCPPDAICSNYWATSAASTAGVCLANCDRASCPANEPICAVYPGLTPDHKYCFGCLQDSDCGAQQRCNLSPTSTFTCVPLK